MTKIEKITTNDNKHVKFTNKAPIKIKKLIIPSVRDGPKTAAHKETIDKTLRELYYEDGITYTHAGEIAGCSPEYASLQFKKIGDEIARNKPIDEDWIAKNDRVRDRALEGLSRQIKDSDQEIIKYQKRTKEMQEIQDLILADTKQQLDDTPIGILIKKAKLEIDNKTLLSIYNMLGSSLNMHKNYGYYVETIINNKREELTFHAQLQQQYDTIEILPPAKEVLNAEIERRIAEKNNIKPVEPLQIVDTEQRIRNEQEA